MHKFKLQHGLFKDSCFRTFLTKNLDPGHFLSFRRSAVAREKIPFTQPPLKGNPDRSSLDSQQKLQDKVDMESKQEESDQLENILSVLRASPGGNLGSPVMTSGRRP